MEYVGLGGNLLVTTSRGGHGGLHVAVDCWDEDRERWITGYDKLVFADSYFEAITDALCVTGFDWDTAFAIATDFGIELPADDEEEV